MPPKQLKPSTEELFFPIAQQLEYRRPASPVFTDEDELAFNIDFGDLTSVLPVDVSICDLFGDFNIDTPRTSPNILFDDAKKIIEPVKTALLTEDQLLQRFSHLIESSPTINTSLLKKIVSIDFLEKSSLDAFLHQSLFNLLAQRGILLLPTISDKEYIGVNQILELIEGKPSSFITNVQCIDNKPLPVFEEIIVPTRFGYLAIPVSMKQDHYGLLIIDITPVPGYSAGAFYFEPFQQNILSDTGLLPTLLSLTHELKIPEEKIQIIHLNQANIKTSGSDYVISVLTRLSLDKLNLAEPASFLKFQDQTLDLDIIHHIRIAQIRLFGPSYFLSQLPLYSQINLSEEEKAILISNIFLTERRLPQVAQPINPPMRRFSDEDIFSDTPTEIDTESESSDEEINHQPRLKRKKAAHDEDASPRNIGWMSMFSVLQAQHLNRSAQIKRETLDEEPSARKAP